MLNRRMPNGTYWWCERGEENLPYSIAVHPKEAASGRFCRCEKLFAWPRAV